MAWKFVPTKDPARWRAAVSLRRSCTAPSVAACIHELRQKCARIWRSGARLTTLQDRRHRRIELAAWPAAPYSHARPERGAARCPSEGTGCAPATSPPRRGRRRASRARGARARNTSARAGSRGRSRTVLLRRHGRHVRRRLPGPVARAHWVHYGRAGCAVVAGVVGLHRSPALARAAARRGTRGGPGRAQMVLSGAPPTADRPCRVLFKASAKKKTQKTKKSTSHEPGEAILAERKVNGDGEAL